MKLSIKLSVEVSRKPKAEPIEYIEVGDDEGSITTYPIHADEPEEPQLGFSLQR